MAHDDQNPAGPRRVVMVAFDRFQLLDLAGPREVLDGANRELGRDAYDIVTASPNGERVRSSSGLEVSADVALAVIAGSREPLDTLMVIGGHGTRVLLDDEAFLTSVRALSDRSRRVTSVCTGALVLAAAGLLDGHRATTHWKACDLLAAYPSVEVLADRIHVHDGNRWTSAGVTAGIDLSLALVDHDHGAEVAHAVAAHLVVFARRPGGQSQFSATLRTEPASSTGIARVQRWLPDHLDEVLTVERLAQRAQMSPRSFARSFRRETGMTPAVHVEELRIEAARRLLETSDLTVDAVARRVGLRHPETLHRAFARRVGTTPARYRQHFGHPA